MAQQHRNQQDQDNQRSRWREGNYGDRNEEDRTREGSRWSEQGGRRGFSEFSRGGESEQSGWGRDSDEDRWTQSGESRYQQGDEYGRGGEGYGGGQQGYGSSQRGYGGSQQGYRGGQHGYGGGSQQGYGGSQQGYGSSGQSRQASYGRSQYGQRAQGGYGGGSESSQGRQDYGRQYESQSFDQPYPQGFQDSYGPSQRATRYGSGREGSAGFGSHSGKGPKGYTRSDERLKEIICEKLTDDPDIDASEISVDVTSQVVKLTGTVDDRSTKYEVEELIERCGGVKDIDNQLRVRSGSSQSSQLRSQGGSMEAAGTYGSGTGQSTSQSTKEGSSSSSGTKRSNN
jgi:osmotically-inducible protein OsmY